MTRKKNFYIPIINILKRTTNLSKICKELSISRQQLNYYLRELQKNGYVFKRSKGWYELTEKCKNMTKYDKILSKDIIRGHAYVWKINLSKGVKNWNKRIEILDKHKFKYKLVGALKTTPSIEILGRKVWLCNKNIRVFDKPKESYYGLNAIESKRSAFDKILLIVGVLNNKLGINLKPIDIYFQKEHYALIRNDLAIEHNQKRERVHISDEYGEWLQMDDSRGEGGELENIGKKAFQTNIPMQKWWNDNKKNKFEVTPTFILDTMNGIQQAVKSNQEMLVGVPKNMELLAKQIELHLNLINEYRNENIAWRKKKEKDLRKELKFGRQTKLDDFKI